MSRVRDIIQEIAEIRKRRRFGTASDELLSRLFSLERAINAHDLKDDETIRYFPVALIACVEAYFRIAIKEIIDKGDPFFSNAEKPLSSVKLDFSVFKAVHGKIISVGELVAHSVQLSRLDQINAMLSTLIGRDFLASLRTVVDRCEHEIRGKPATPILSAPDEVFAGVARTFELRHIICHEIASAYEIKTEEVNICFEHCVDFLRAADEFLSQLLNPDAPLTQTDMNIAAGKALTEQQELLAKAVEELKARLEPSEFPAFDKAHVQWQLYCDSWANFIAGERATCGTIWPLIYASAAEETVKRRLDEIKGYRRLNDPA